MRVKNKFTNQNNDLSSQCNSLGLAIRCGKATSSKLNMCYIQRVVEQSIQGDFYTAFLKKKMLVKDTCGFQAKTLSDVHVQLIRLCNWIV